MNSVRYGEETWLYGEVINVCLKVEAALLGEPYNEELLKLRQDLEEIIKLQEELLQENSNGSQAASTQPLPSWKVC